jgi:hypothetical protein
VIVLTRSVDVGHVSDVVSALKLMLRLHFLQVSDQRHLRRRGLGEAAALDHHLHMDRFQRHHVDGSALHRGGHEGSFRDTIER